MTRKDYEAVAKALRTYTEEVEANPSPLGAGIIRRDTRADIVEVLAEVFEADNPNFSADKFRQACR